jgi:hypothetical protein
VPPTPVLLAILGLAIVLPFYIAFRRDRRRPRTVRATAKVLPEPVSPRLHEDVERTASLDRPLRERLMQQTWGDWS